MRALADASGRVTGLCHEIGEWCKCNVLPLSVVWYTDLVVPALAQLYFKTPELWGIGGWGGMHPIDICTHLNRPTPSSHWREFPAECDALLAARFEGFEIVVRYALVIYAMHLSVRWLVLRPMLARQKLDSYRERLAIYAQLIHSDARLRTPPLPIKS